jgi:hypothetical protein
MLGYALPPLPLLWGLLLQTRHAPSRWCMRVLQASFWSCFAL